jgi:hypothetical protein
LNAFTRLSKGRQLNILDSATDCFAEKGYYGASIKDICQKANISNGVFLSESYATPDDKSPISFVTLYFKEVDNQWKIAGVDFDI